MQSHYHMLRKLWRELLFLAVAALWCIPFYYLTIISVKPDDEVFTAPMRFPSRLEFGNFAQAWSGTGGTNLGQALFNSAIITVGAVVLLIGVGSLTAYVVARNRSIMGGWLYGFFVLGIILPYQLSVVPLYTMFRSIGLVGNHLGMMILYAGLLLPLSVFLYTGFVRSLPKDYEEAAQVDGAKPFKIFFRIVFPMLRPVTATVAVVTGMIVWNDFFLQMVFLTGSRAQTLPVAIYGFVGEFSARWNMVFAAVCVSIGPILAFYLVAQRQFVQGFTGGIKS